MTRKIHASYGEMGPCPHLEEQRRLGKWQSQPQPYFIRGKAAHFAREFALTMFIQHGELPSLAHVEEKAVGDTEAAEDEIDDREPWRRRSTEEELTEGIDAALPIIRADYAIGIPTIAPFVDAVEDFGEMGLTDDAGEPIDAVLVGSCDVRGHDPVTGTPTILDLKTTKSNPGAAAQAKADMSQQLSIYAIMHRAVTGKIPIHCLDYLWPGKRKPKSMDGVTVHEFKTPQPGDVKLVMRRVVTTSRSASDLDAAMRRLRVKLDAIKYGWFPPAPTSGMISPCASCWHRANPDPEQRCEYVPDVRSSEVQR